MEYCIEVWVETFQPNDRLVKVAPTETAWGPAYRDNEDREYRWSEDLSAYLDSPHAFLFEYVPIDYRDTTWIQLSIHGSALDDFERAANQDKELARAHRLIELIDWLLDQQSKWVIFFSRDCDEIAISHLLHRREVASRIVQAYQWDIPDNHGFCAYPPID